MRDTPSGRFPVLRLHGVSDTDTTTWTARAVPSPRAGVQIETFASAADTAGGVRLRDLAAFDRLIIRTRNSVYDVTVLDAATARILAVGGFFLPGPVEVTLSGATLGGSLLKVGWILLGFHLEFLHDRQRVVTTRVRDVRRVAASRLPGPF